MPTSLTASFIFLGASIMFFAWAVFLLPLGDARTCRTRDGRIEIRPRRSVPYSCKADQQLQSLDTEIAQLKATLARLERSLPLSSVA